MAFAPPPQTAARTWPARVVIAIDIDSFYVACERLLNPSLIGKPVGIQQKYLLATCSYEARALGCSKLQGVKEAKRVCPELILVNGEDLTYYRRFSRAICRLVKGIIWGRKVERLGMDELFCDVTDMVSAHLEDLKAGSSSSKTFFNLSTDRSSRSNGFYYDSSDQPSLIIPAPSTDASAEYSPLFAATSQLAAHIRGRIHHELGFTTSAGVAHNKTIAKLVASLNKPALQTTWSPEIPKYRMEQQAFLAGFEARKLQGMGHAICKTIQAAIAERSPEDAEAPLTIALIRAHCSSSDFTTWFGAKLGPRLWNLIHGDDDEPVNPSPEYPLQISVENSHLGASFDEAIKEIGALSLHLLKRLKEDLTEGIDDNPLVAVKKETSGKAKAIWAQYPTTLRLTIRQGYDRSRESKSVAFPQDAIDEDIPVEERARILTSGILTTLLKKVVKQGDTKCRITILNVCAANFTTSRPSQNIAAALAASKKPKKREEVDLTLLPSDDVDPLTRSVGTEPIIIEDDEDQEEVAYDMEEVTPFVTNDSLLEIPSDSGGDGEEEDDLEFIGEDRPAFTTCKVCGSRLFAFSAAAHKAFHENDGSKTIVSNGSSATKKRKSQAQDGLGGRGGRASSIDGTRANKAARGANNSARKGSK